MNEKHEIRQISLTSFLDPLLVSSVTGLLMLKPHVDLLPTFFFFLLLVDPSALSNDPYSSSTFMVSQEQPSRMDQLIGERALD